MKKSLSHVPEKKREELRRAIEHIRLHCSKTEMIILFGSFARGDWAEDNYTVGHTTFEHRSDFDLLIVVRNEKTERDAQRWNAVETAISQDDQITTPIEVIPAAINHLNEQLEKGRYFYRDIRKEGIVLLDSGRFKLAQPKELTPEERHQLAEEDFSIWTNKARVAFETYRFNFKHRREDQEYLNLAAYHLHQTAEHLLTAAGLVYANYRPKTHDLAALLTFVSRYESRFEDAFPGETREDKRRFKLLRRAYVDARFEPRIYSIREDDLVALEKRIQSLTELTNTTGREKIDSLV